MTLLPSDLEKIMVSSLTKLQLEKNTCCHNECNTPCSQTFGDFQSCIDHVSIRNNHQCELSNKCWRVADIVRISNAVYSLKKFGNILSPETPFFSPSSSLVPSTKRGRPPKESSSSSSSLSSFPSHSPNPSSSPSPCTKKSKNSSTTSLQMFPTQEVFSLDERKGYLENDLKTLFWYFGTNSDHFTLFKGAQNILFSCFSSPSEFLQFHNNETSVISDNFNSPIKFCNFYQQGDISTFSNKFKKNQNLLDMWKENNFKMIIESFPTEEKFIEPLLAKSKLKLIDPSSPSLAPTIEMPLPLYPFPVLLSFYGDSASHIMIVLQNFGGSSNYPICLKSQYLIYVPSHFKIFIFNYQIGIEITPYAEKFYLDILLSKKQGHDGKIYENTPKIIKNAMNLVLHQKIVELKVTDNELSRSLSSLIENNM